MNAVHIVVAMKPVQENYTDNAQRHGVAGLNIHGCRIGETTRTNSSSARKERTGFVDGFVGGTETEVKDYGRWPANVIHDGLMDLEFFKECKA